MIPLTTELVVESPCGPGARLLPSAGQTLVRGAHRGDVLAHLRQETVRDPAAPTPRLSAVSVRIDDVASVASHAFASGPVPREGAQHPAGQRPGELALEHDRTAVHDRRQEAARRT